MKTHVCLIFALIYCLQVSAQKVRDKQLMVENGLIDVQVGLAIPVLDFADKSFKLASGYADPGYSVKLGIRYDIAPFMGVGLHFQYFQNGFDNSNYLTDLREANKTITINSYTSNPWSLQGVLLSLYLPLRSSRTSVDVGVSGGVLAGVYPESILNFNSPTVPGFVYNIKQYETSAANFAIQGGVKMRYQLYKNIMVTASADFTYTEIEFKELHAEETNTHTSISPEAYTQYYHIIQLAAGIGIQVK